MVADNRSIISKFVSSVSDSVVKECRTAMLIKKIDLSIIMLYAQQIKKKKLKEKERQNKRVKIGDFNFSHQRSDDGNHF